MVPGRSGRTCDALTGVTQETRGSASKSGRGSSSSALTDVPTSVWRTAKGRFGELALGNLKFFFFFVPAFCSAQMYSISGMTKLITPLMATPVQVTANCMNTNPKDEGRECTDVLQPTASIEHCSDEPGEEHRPEVGHRYNVLERAQKERVHTFAAKSALHQVVANDDRGNWNAAQQHNSREEIDADLRHNVQETTRTARV